MEVFVGVSSDGGRHLGLDEPDGWAIEISRLVGRWCFRFAGVWPDDLALKSARAARHFRADKAKVSQGWLKILQNLSVS